MDITNTIMATKEGFITSLSFKQDFILKEASIETTEQSLMEASYLSRKASWLQCQAISLTIKLAWREGRLLILEKGDSYLRNASSYEI